MTRPKKQTKPEPPYADCPLYAHSSGQYARPIIGTVHYFGSWSKGGAAAIERYSPSEITSTPVPRRQSPGAALGDILNSFHKTKQHALEQGSLTQRSFNEYEAVCDSIAAQINKTRPMDSISRSDLEQLRSTRTKGKNGKPISPTSAKRILTMARSVFYHANEECGFSVKYKQALRSPSANQMRRARHETGERLFTAEEIRAVLAVAKPQLKAMILLGINCGFGNQDCATLPIEQVDLAKGWHPYWRPKTQTPRLAPLWAETAAALYAVIKGRKSGYVFKTQAGNPWFNPNNRSCPITFRFRKALKKVGVFREGITTF